MNIEVCCGSYVDALNAYQGGADRVELCSSLFFGGLTPSLGSLKLLKKNTTLDVAVMVRPREGGFCYTKNEFDIIKEDIKLFIENGADAIVFGLLNNDSTIDYKRCKELIKLVNNKCDTVFHKAFDVSTEPLIESAKKLKELGITRILTGGKKETALEGALNLKKLIDLGGIEILPAGSIRMHNLEKIHKTTNCKWIHTSAFESLYDKSGLSETIKFTNTILPKQGQYNNINIETVKDIVNLGRNL